MALAVVLAGTLAYQWQADDVAAPVNPNLHSPQAARAAEVITAPRIDRAAIEALLRTDPLAALIRGREHHARTVRDYSCKFTKCEQLDEGLSPEQEIAVKFVQSPYSIMMHWLRNPGKAERVIYVANRWIDAAADRPEERDLAICQPGPIARIFVKSVKQPIRGKHAKEASRRFIDEFGFLNGLDLIIEFTSLARKNNELLRFTMTGTGEFDGRPTWVLERELPPYVARQSRYPDALAIYHIDQEWLVPTAIYSYADRERKKLLGWYEYRDVRMNAGCTAADFEPSTYGM